MSHDITQHCTTSESGSGAGAGEGWETGAEGEVGGVPLIITPPLDKHGLNVKESEIEWKGIEPKVRAQMWHGAPRFLVWNSVTFFRVWLRSSEYSQVCIFLCSVAFPFDQILEFLSEHSTVQDLSSQSLEMPCICLHSEGQATFSSAPHGEMCVHGLPKRLQGLEVLQPNNTKVSHLRMCRI